MDNQKKIMSLGILFSLLAILLYLFPVKIPVEIANVCSLVGGLTSPIAMMLIGSSVASLSFKEILGDRKEYIFTLMKQCVTPALLYVLMLLVVRSEFVRTVIFILVLMPSANVAVLYANEYGKDEKTAAKVVLLTTIFSLVSIPLMMFFAQAVN